MANFTVEEVRAVSEKYGKVLDVKEPLDGCKVMMAIAMVESSGGLNCGPRYEPSYDIGGHNCSYIQKACIEHYGHGACYSYGPWQMMFINCAGYSPAELETNLESCARCFVAFFNHYVIKIKKAVTLQDIGEVWNSGHIRSGYLFPGIATYVKDLEAAYEHLPEYDA